MQDVTTYLKKLPDEQRVILEHIRRVVQQHVPDAIESISYDMPTFKYMGKPLFYYAAFKHHMSIFPTPEPADQLAKELAAFKTSKGTIQFTTDHVLSDDIIIALLDLHLAAIKR